MGSRLISNMCMGLRFVLVQLALLSILTASTLHERRVLGKFTHEGLEVECSIKSIGHDRPLKLQAGEPVCFQFSVIDSTSGEPISGLYPAAWVHKRPAGFPRPNYVKMAETFISGGLFSKPDIDLNVYHVVALNGDRTISVVDPLFGFGGSKLLNLVDLPENGSDWVKMSRAPKLFISLPESQQIADVNTSSWQASHFMTQVNRPTVLALQPDEQFLWASMPDGVSIFRTEPFSMQYMLPVGKGPHAFTFTADGRYAFVSSHADSSLSIIDLANFDVVQSIKLDSPPTSLTYSEQSNAVYVLQSESGQIACIEADSHQLYRTIQSEPGLSELKFPPMGRFGFLINPKTDRLSILDTALDRIIQDGIVESGPTEITFSDNFAYIRHSRSPKLLLVPLDSPSLGVPSAPITTVEAPAGDAAYAHLGKLNTAVSITQAPGANAVLIANPEDKAIYFFKEGMAAPMGQFNNYGRKPHAVEVIDRSLRERSSSGVYTTVATLEAAGLSDIVFFMDSPRMIHGFELNIAPATTDLNVGPQIIEVQSKNFPQSLGVKVHSEIKFQTQAQGTVPKGAIEAYTYMTGGNWQDRQKLTISEKGLGSLYICPPLAGHYQIILKSPLSGYRIQQNQRFVFSAVTPETKLKINLNQ